MYDKPGLYNVNCPVVSKNYLDYPNGNFKFADNLEPVAINLVSYIGKNFPVSHSQQITDVSLFQPNINYCLQDLLLKNKKEVQCNAAQFVHVHVCKCSQSCVRLQISSVLQFLMPMTPSPITKAHTPMDIQLLCSPITFMSPISQNVYIVFCQH